MAKTKHVKLYSNPLNRFLVDLIWITKTTAPFLLITGRTEDSLFHFTFWRINNVGCWCTFLRTIKVEHGAGGRRVPRHPRNLAVRQTARMSRKAVCTTDGWSVQLTSYFSGLALSPCLIIIPTWEWGCVLCCVCGGGYLFFFRGGGSGWDVQQVNVSMLVRCLTLIMYEMYVCMSTWKFDGALEPKACAHT